MKKRLTKELLRKITKTIIATVNPKQIVLFGSYAKGKHHRHSDIDILIVNDHEYGDGRSRRQEMAKLWRVLAQFDFAKDILVYSAKEVAQWKNTKNHIIAVAFREGQILYDRN